MKLLKRVITCICLTTACEFAIAETNLPKNADKPIQIILNDWTSQRVLARITGQILTHSGYSVAYREATTDQQWGALAMGIEHVQIEVWEGTMSDMFSRMVAAGKILDAGKHSAITREEWWYPDYAEAQCPGLPDWKALQRCAEKFSTAATHPAGHYFAGPWEKPEEAKIRALGLNFKSVQVQNADALWDALEKATKAQRPIVLFNWTPNWVEARYDGKFIEFPAYAPECESDPSWGINKDFHHDCGNPKNGWLKKATWSGMPSQWPCAYEIVKNINFSNAMIADLSASVDIDKLTYDEASTNWLNKNEQLWRSWVPSQCI